MDIRKVKKLIELLEESGIAEIEIHEGEESVRISRYSQNAPAAAPVQYAPAVAPAPVAEAAPAAESSADAIPSGHSVDSPMVGTYYGAALQVRRTLSTLATPLLKAKLFALSKR